MGLAWGYSLFWCININRIFRLAYTRRTLLSSLLTISGLAFLVRRLGPRSRLVIMRRLELIQIRRLVLYTPALSFLSPLTSGPTSLFSHKRRIAMDWHLLTTPLLFFISLKPFQLLFQPLLPHHDTPHHFIQLPILCILTTTVSSFIIPYRPMIVGKGSEVWYGFVQLLELGLDAKRRLLIFVGFLGWWGLFLYLLGISGFCCGFCGLVAWLRTWLIALFTAI